MDNLSPKTFKNYEVELEVLEEYSDSQLAVVEVYVCHDGNNHHNMPIPLKAIKKAKYSLANKFLVAGYDGEDFEGHEPDEQIVGFFPKESKMTFRKKDGKTFLVAQAIMSKVYADWAYEILQNDNDKSVSMEISVFETEINEDDGLEHITEFVFNGVTLLGESHPPACEGANASIIKFSEENALKIYSEHFGKNSDKTKRDFIENMALTDSGKEESDKMEDDNKVTKEEEKEMSTEVKETEKEESTEKDLEKDVEMAEDKSSEEDSEETTYMNKDCEKEDKDDDDEDEDDEEDKEEDDEKSEKEMSKESEKDFSLTVEQKYEIFRTGISENVSCYGYLESFDDEYLYVYSWMDDCTYRYGYSLNEMSCSIDEESKSRVMRAGYVEFSEGDEKSVEEKTLMNENCELKAKLKKYEEAEKEKEIESILSNVVDALSTERMSELREEAEEINIEGLTAFANKVKAEAFEAMKDSVKVEKYSFTRMNIAKTEQTSKYGW